MIGPNRPGPKTERPNRAYVDSTVLGRTNRPVRPVLRRQLQAGYVGWTGRNCLQEKSKLPDQDIYAEKK